ncbi:unnamed protein product [Blepharisma stoltei]|uniref:Uncharacterized protein n=1 Tax=Blepharisma stoltei TaxID=1481888 RepID=A0AAU9J551_9CILI|nr:unnamed protein product [Blepharisma stoltei]
MKSERQGLLPAIPLSYITVTDDPQQDSKEQVSTPKNPISLENIIDHGNISELHNIQSERTPKSTNYSGLTSRLPESSRKISRNEIERLLNEYQASFDYGRANLTVDCAGPRLGPGYYNIGLSTLGGTSFQFSTTCRFRRPESLGLYASQDKSKSATDILKHNKNMLQHKLSNRLYLSKIKSEVEAARICQAKRKKEFLLFQKKIEIQSKIEDKQRRLIMKVKRAQVSHIVKAWCILLIVASWNTEATYKIKYRKDLHARSQKVLKMLFIMCKSIGKFKILAQRARSNLAVKKLQILSKPIHIHLKHIKVAYKNRITDVFERTLMSDTLFQLMAWWRNRLIFIQRTWKHMHIEKKTSMIIRKTIWNKVEYKMHREQLVKMRKYSKDELHKPIEQKAILGNSTIPDEVKEFYIKMKLKERLNEFLVELEKYKHACKFITEKNRSEGIELEFPEKPVRNYVLLDHDFRHMIIQCIEKRSEWPRIMGDNEC